MPWKEFDCEDEVRELLKIRESDENTYKIDDEYVFCDNLIVAPLTAESDTRKVYLPEGKWVDYWTKEPVECGWFEVTTENIPVYEKC